MKKITFIRFLTFIGLLFSSLISFAQTTIPVAVPTGGFEIDGDLKAGTLPGDFGGDWLPGDNSPYNSSTYGVFNNLGPIEPNTCLLYTSDAADDFSTV